MLKRKQKSDNECACDIQAKKKVVNEFDVMWNEVIYLLRYCRILGIFFLFERRKRKVIFPLLKQYSERTNERTSHGQVATMVVTKWNPNMESETERMKQKAHKNVRTYSHFYDLNVLVLFFLSIWNSVAEQFLCSVVLI